MPPLNLELFTTNSADVKLSEQAALTSQYRFEVTQLILYTFSDVFSCST